MRHSHREILKDDLVWFRDEGGSFEFATSNDLGLDDAFLLTNARLLHILLLE